MVVRNGRLVSFKDASYSCPSSASDRSSTTSYSKRKSKGIIISSLIFVIHREVRIFEAKVFVLAQVHTLRG
jgi:hypothetical protein